jgi:hypothetical protein
MGFDHQMYGFPAKIKKKRYFCLNPSFSQSSESADCYPVAARSRMASLRSSVAPKKDPHIFHLLWGCALVVKANNISGKWGEKPGKTLPNSDEKPC